ncbi:MAG TPA: tyrosine--tRNA ligase [Dehalococcoidia bacterium]|nr:tyrosine--tRNA ligase [Dehalococcoidia bacterium]
MARITASVEEQMSVLMSGVDYGDANIQRTMEEDLRERLQTGRPLRVYAGFDPTGTGLHLGHLVPMLKLRQFQRFGHEVTFLMGTMTAVVGDPSDKSAARQMLTAEEVEANARTWLDQAFRVLDPERTRIARNGEWLAPLTLAEVVQLASKFTVGQFLDHETFRRRMEEGKPLYLHEFIYALMQAYDAYYLKTDVQVGGTDQLFNIMQGRHLQRAMGERPLVAVCVPLLLGTDGREKMSKSLGNYIGLDEEPSDMYGKLMSIADSLLVNYYTHLTEMSRDEVAELERGLASGAVKPMEAKKRLAYSVVELLHGREAAEAAQAEFEVIHQTQTPLPTPEAMASDLIPLPATTVDVPVDFEREPWAQVSLPHLLHQSGVVSSVSAARRLIEQGAVEQIGSSSRQEGWFSRQHPKVLGKPTFQAEPGMVIRVGKAKFIRIVKA